MAASVTTIRRSGRTRMRKDQPMRWTYPGCVALSLVIATMACHRQPANDTLLAGHDGHSITSDPLHAFVGKWVDPHTSRIEYVITPLSDEDITIDLPSPNDVWEVKVSNVQLKDDVLTFTERYYYVGTDLDEHPFSGVPNHVTLKRMPDEPARLRKIVRSPHLPKPVESILVRDRGEEE